MPVPVFNHDMKTCKNDERRGEAETFVSFKCLWSMIRNVERVCRMTSQTHGQTGWQVLFSIVGPIVEMVI